MRLIHCADLHLDSKLNTRLDRERARRRRNELLRNFSRLAAYAEENRVEVVLIAGDLFDRDTVSALARNTVLEVIRDHPRIRFYYLRGNHDRGDCFGQGKSSEEKIPSNLFLFGNRWKTYIEGAGGQIAISGIELTRENNVTAPADLRLDSSRFNIVMLHGQETAGSPPGPSAPENGTNGTGSRLPGGDRGESAGNAGLINLRLLRGRGIDYLALGHIHAYKKAPLDNRGIYCWPGCLEGRGFDECGPHGFALLEIDETRRTMSHRFIPFARRILHAVDVDVSGCFTTAGMWKRIENALREADCAEKDMVDLILRGELDIESEKNPGYLQSELEARFFFARLQDRTTLKIDPAAYLYDESLRGEFVRTVMEDPSILPKEKAAVIRYGFQAMDGETLI